MLSPQTLLSHDSSDSHGKDIVYKVVQALQNYDTVFHEIHSNLDMVFGRAADSSSPKYGYILKINSGIAKCHTLVQKLRKHHAQLKGLANLLHTKEISSADEVYFKTLSLLDVIVHVQQIIDAYNLQTVANEDMIRKLLTGAVLAQDLKEFLRIFSLQATTFAVKHNRAIIYVDCIK